MKKNGLAITMYAEHVQGHRSLGDEKYHILHFAVLMIDETGSYRNPPYDSDLGKMEIRAYVSGKSFDGKPYGWGSPCYYDVAEVDSRKCARMGKTLRVIEGKIRKLSDRLGAPHTLGQHVNRFALALGASHMVLHEFKPGSSSYESAKRTVVELGEIAVVVDRRAEALVAAA